MPSETETILTDTDIQAIEASLPRCPQCASPIKLVHFVAHETHRLEIQIDGSNGEVLAYSQHHDTLDRKPKLTWYSGFPEVECESGHSWQESRLTWNGAGEWSIRAPEVDELHERAMADQPGAAS